MCSIQGKGMGDFSFIERLGCIAVDIHNISFLSNPCLHDFRHGEILCKSNFLFRNVKRATGKSTDLSTPKVSNYTWILETILNQRKIHAVPPPQPISVYVCLIWFSIPCAVLKPGRHGSTGKGTYPRCYLKRC